MLFSAASASLHEIYAVREGDGAAAGAFALGVVEHAAPKRSLLWVRHQLLEHEAGLPFPPGLAEWGFDLTRVILVRARDPAAALQAGLEGARTPGLGAVVIELWGAAKAYDLTASRRLALAAKASGVLVLIARTSATAQPSAAETRWRLSALSSRVPFPETLAVRAPGPPAFELVLIRARNGQEGITHHLEWNRDERRFAILRPGSGRNAGISSGKNRAPLSGRVAAFPPNRPAAPPARRAG